MIHSARASLRLWRLRRSTLRFLKAYAGIPVLFYPNPGNAGDSLIAAGEIEAFRRCAIPFETIAPDADVRGRTVMLGGGGNLVPLYKSMRTAYENFMDSAKELILLPQTVRGHEDLLARSGDNCTVFVRDPESYAHVRSTNPRLRCFLAHDMAFHVRARELLGDPALSRRAEPVWRERLGQAGLDVDTLPDRPCWNFLRTDREARGNAPQTDLDLSHVLMLGVKPEKAQLAAWCLLKTLSLARSVVTDRLHVAIAAALLGVECELRDNSYGKNAGVHQHSMAGAFPKLRFRAAGPAG